MLLLTKYESNLIAHDFCSPSHYNGGRGGDLIWKFANILWWQILFLHLWQDKPLWVELKTNGGVIFITILLHLNYIIFLETANTQKSGVFFKNFIGKFECISCYLSIFSNFTISVLGKNFLETLCMCIYSSSTTRFLKNSPTSWVSSL